MTSVQQMNDALRALGGRATRYRAGDVAWNDNARGTKGGSLSCWGKNITDARIVAEDGTHLPFVRPDNMDEELGIVPADKLWMVDADGTRVDVHTVLRNLSQRVAYRDMFSSVDMRLPEAAHAAPPKVVFRVQNAWVPLPGDGKAPRKIAPAHMSYQTASRNDPRNLLVVGTPEGIFVHADEPGIHKLKAHRTSSCSEAVQAHWFTASASDELVGKASCLSRKASSCDVGKKDAAHEVTVGLEGMGARSNCFLILSIPRKQAPPLPAHWFLDDDWSEVPKYRGLTLAAKEEDWEEGWDEDDEQVVYRSLGTSRAAVVGVDGAPGMEVAPHDVKMDMVRDESEAIVATLLLYNTLHGGDQVDSVDLALAVADMEGIYDRATELGGTRCPLSRLPACLHELEVAHTNQIHRVMANGAQRASDQGPVGATKAAPASA